jgi:hypothetical protein
MQAGPSCRPPSVTQAAGRHAGRGPSRRPRAVTQAAGRHAGRGSSYRPRHQAGSKLVDPVDLVFAAREGARAGGLLAVGRGLAGRGGREGLAAPAGAVVAAADRGVRDDDRVLVALVPGVPLAATGDKGGGRMEGRGRPRGPGARVLRGGARRGGGEGLGAARRGADGLLAGGRGAAGLAVAGGGALGDRSPGAAAARAE